MKIIQDEKDKVSLRDRLEAARKGKPADSAYASHMAELLDQVLASPVISDPEGFELLENVREVLPDLTYSPTYGDILKAVRDLTRLYLSDGDTGKYVLAGELMTTLLDWLADGPDLNWLTESPDPDWLADDLEYTPESGERPRSLCDRLRDIQGTPARARIAGATAYGYFQGAAARLGTRYPLDIYSLDRNGDTTIKEFANHLLKQWFHQVPPRTQDGQARISDTFYHMYSILVQPILPDEDALRSMRDQRTA